MSEDEDSILSRWSKPLADAARKLSAGPAPKGKEPRAPLKQIGCVRAVVECPVYEGETLERHWNDFTHEGRPCKTISSRVIRSNS